MKQRVRVWVCPGFFLTILILFMLYFNWQHARYEGSLKQDIATNHDFHKTMEGVTQSVSRKVTNAVPAEDKNIPEITYSSIQGVLQNVSRKVTNTVPAEDKNIPESTYSNVPNENKNMSDAERRLSRYPPFQPSEEAEFPTTKNKQPRIQHIIHQVNCEAAIPQKYERLVETFLEKNPSWQYRFWSHDSGRKLLQKRYLYLLPVFDNLETCDERRTNMLKYVVLHEFGGVYSDFDMENLRPLDNVTLKYACIIPAEPYENTAMRFQKSLSVFDRFDLFDNPQINPTLVSELIFCRAGHPFLYQCLQNFKPLSQVNSLEDFGGNKFITLMFKGYNNLTNEKIRRRIHNPSSNSPYFYKGERPEDGIDSVYIPNSQYFYDTVDPIYIDEKTGNLENCWKYEQMSFLSVDAKRACVEFERRKKVRKNQKYTYIYHHFYNSQAYDNVKWINGMEKIPILEVAPNCIIY